MPLTVPQRPWSHPAVDFVMDLPVSRGYTVILVAVDHFSKGVRFIPFKSAPTALEVAEALFQVMFLHYGIPEEIISDRGAQFISCVWTAFLGTAVSLTSGGPDLGVPL